MRGYNKGKEETPFGLPSLLFPSLRATGKEGKVESACAIGNRRTDGLVWTGQRQAGGWTKAGKGTTHSRAPVQSPPVLLHVVAAVVAARPGH
jgi:hypothetical protein